jgi:hypothetical protein
MSASLRMWLQPGPSWRKLSGGRKNAPGVGREPIAIRPRTSPHGRRVRAVPREALEPARVTVSSRSRSCFKAPPEQKQPAVVSFAQVSYRPLHMYYFVNAPAQGVGRVITGNRKPASQASRSRSWRSSRTTTCTRTWKGACARAWSRFDSSWNSLRSTTRSMIHPPCGRTSRARRRGTARTVPPDHKKRDWQRGDDAQPDRGHGWH